VVAVPPQQEPVWAGPNSRQPIRRLLPRRQSSRIRIEKHGGKQSFYTRWLVVNCLRRPEVGLRLAILPCYICHAYSWFYSAINRAAPFRITS
jgi:hypothetical protein